MRFAIITTIILSCFTITSAQFGEGFMAGYITRNIYRNIKKHSNIKKYEGVLYYRQCKRVSDFPKIQSYCSNKEIISYIQSNYQIRHILLLRNMVALVIIYSIPIYVIKIMIWGSNRERRFLCGLLSGMLAECIINMKVKI